MDATRDGDGSDWGLEEGEREGGRRTGEGTQERERDGGDGALGEDRSASRGSTTTTSLISGQERGGSGHFALNPCRET